MKNEADSLQLKQKLKQISNRMQLHSACTVFYKSSALLLLLSLALLLISRFLSLIPDVFNYLTILIPFGIAVVIAILFRKTPKIAECAKLADNTHSTKDLFSTASSIKNAHGEFSPIVIKNAESKATTIDPKQIIQFKFSKQIQTIIMLLVLVVTGACFLPHLDLLGRDVAKQKKKENQKKLVKLEKSVKERLKILQKQSHSKNSPEVEKILAKIKSQFNSLKKSQPKANREKLKQMQRNLSDIWKKKQKDKLRDQLQTNLGKQSFGMLDKKEQTWQKQLKKNSFSAIKKEAEELKKLAQKISEMSDSKEKDALKKELSKKMKALSDFMASQLGSKSAQGALKDAMKQLDMSNLKGLSKEALNAMQNSMQLFKRELDRLGQMTNDINQLEMAMEAAQLAKQLNQLGEMQDAGQGGMESMEDYAEFYKNMMAGQGKGQGERQGQPGNPGGGAKPPEENTDAETGTKKEISKSQLQPGKILMKWNTKGMGKTGKAKEEYLKSVKKVKQGVSEAILKEQVPPGYHKSIQKYFDNIEK